MRHRSNKLLNAERIAVAEAFELKVRSVEENFRKSLKIDQDNMAATAAERHTRRGAPLPSRGLTTWFRTEDVPSALVLAKIAGEAAPDWLTVDLDEGIDTVLAAFLHRNRPGTVARPGICAGPATSFRMSSRTRRHCERKTCAVRKKNTFDLCHLRDENSLHQSNGERNNEGNSI